MRIGGLLFLFFKCIMKFVGLFFLEKKTANFFFELCDLNGQFFVIGKQICIKFFEVNCGGYIDL